MGIEPPGDPRSVETPSIYPTADGWIGFNTNGPQHAEAFLRLIERDDLIEAGYVNAGVRVGNRHEFDGWVRDWTTSLTSAEILERAAVLRVPTARVNDAATVLDEEQLVARDFYVPSADGRLRVPRPHYRIDGRRPPAARPGRRARRRRGRGPRHQRRPRGRGPARASLATVATESAPTPGATRPLEGLKVLDITSWWAGPSNTQLLAALGADVVHVESIAHPDPMRYAAAVAFLDRERWWELSSFYICINTNKRGITLDLGRPEGVALAERLIGWADVVVENYTPRVMPKFGLDWERVHELNPAAVMVRQPAFGLDGPWAERLGFAQNMEQMCGMAFLTGHADQQPLVPRGPCDPLGGAHAAFATLVALARRATTGVGSLVEVALIEGALNVTAEPVVEYSATGRIMGREATGRPTPRPRACTRATTTSCWRCRSPPTPSGPPGGPARAPGRRGDRPRGRADDPGRPSAPPRPPRRGDRRLGLAPPGGLRRSTSCSRPGCRRPHWPTPAPSTSTPSTWPAATSRTRLTPCSARCRSTACRSASPVATGWNERPAPVVGEHNDEVLGGLLGLGEDDMAALAAAGVIGDRPAGT